MRIAAIVEYDGSGFSGWQVQDGVRTVQAEVEAAIGKVADEPVRVTVAGRTDTGVHATGQVIHFDSNAERSSYSWVNGVNALLTDDSVTTLEVQTDHTKCAFGKWLLSDACVSRRNDTAYRSTRDRTS